VKDFYSEEQPKNYKDMYKNFTGFIDTLNSSLLVKLDVKEADAAQKPDVESSSQINSSENTPWENPATRTTEPAGLVYPPVAPFGHDDTFPAPGAGFYPHSGAGRGGSMHVGPNDPRFFPSNPYPAPFGGPGSVPPGGRYDPIGPPDVPGFEPSRFVRRSRHPGGSTHPDLEFFQQGPDF
jgi:proteasome inhibitor subunit 1 (PI31)